MSNSISSRLQFIAEKHKRNYNSEELYSELRQLENELKTEIHSTEPESHPVPISEVMDESLKRVLSPKGWNEHNLLSGFLELDALTFGFAKGELIVIGARPAIGKTFFLINICRNIAERGNATAFFTMDLTKEQLSYRFLAIKSGLPAYRLLQANISETEKLIAIKAAESFKNLPVYIDDCAVSNVFVLKEKIIALVKEKNVKIVFVDYLQMISTNNKRISREAEISLVCREFKNLAKDLDICIIVSSQLSRAVEQRGGCKRPQLSDLRESGAIEQDADKVFFIYRAEMVGITVDENGNSTEGVAEIIMAKNRNGRVGSINLIFDSQGRGFFTAYDAMSSLSIDVNRLNDLN